MAAHAAPTAPASGPGRVWIGAGLGLLLGAAVGLVSGLHAVRAHRYLEQQMHGLAAATLAEHARAAALYALVWLGAAQLGLWAWERRFARWPGPGALGLALWLAAGALLPLNRTPWYPGARTPAGLALNLGLLGLALAAGLALGRRGRLRALSVWLASPAAGRRTAWAGIAGVAVLGAALTAGGRVAPSAPADAPHVILISIDTLRQDHLGLYGYPRDTTPNIDALARDGVVFSQATTPRPKTTPSVASMLTGLYPHRSGVRLLVDRLPARFPTLAEVFRQAGYRTAAVVSNYVLNADQSGLDAGFEHFDDETPEFEGTQRDAAHTTDRAIEWLARRRGERVFLWVHYMDPHGPYASPPPYTGAFRSPAGETREVALSKIPPASRLAGRTDLTYYVDQYDAEILYTDHHVGRLLRALEALGLRERSIVVLTSDHGESLGEHEYYFEHGKYLYDDCARIPLVLEAPGLPGGRRIADPVEITDLYPTLLALAGLDPPAPTDGVSLAPLLDGERSPRPPRAFIERSTLMKAVRTPDWKLIQTFGADGSVARTELYDLASDPGETLDLATQRPERVAALEEMLRGWVESDPLMSVRPGADELGALPEDVTEKLRALGYVE